MELRNPPTQFSFPNLQPNSPPATPNSTQPRNTFGASYYSSAYRRRHGIAKFGLSPPDYIAPKGEGHQFSYTPPDRDGPSDSESDPVDEESDTSSQIEHEVLAVSSEQDSDVLERRTSTIRSINEDTDFTLEELSDDDIGHDDLEVIYPDQTEDAKSENGSKASECDIIDALKNLKCKDKEELARALQFDAAQREAYQKRKKRWSVGGYKKRSHAQSVGSQSSGHEDIEPLDDIHLPGASARRLRRRTQGPEDSEPPNRTSLIFDDPPKELEELAVEDPPPLLDSDGELWSDDDGVEEIELLLPAWLMDLESNPPSRPSTAVSVESASISTPAI
ncbi:hypothetical protein, variant [Verruconis gallopava]|uniref:Uncharacterized protein n=1 Tax=Verruconis gallopava TaxID=253628 RepID=A0A0D2B2K8_9PEZI|nr:uncharacterized protein PV09_03377 [Verruconis gallopava]XP_016215363.1 hypothetical protein, variant [Verruconis gallopava]KIW05493.1 hypothetical protein PV09_03377 [Verruconis gallopava]KIW05494.1 hypothetical protein, variant [Verruconis gallopava]